MKEIGDWRSVILMLGAEAAVWAQTTFTPQMATRNGGGPFCAGPIVQGAWATADGSGDTLTFSRGRQISGNFYECFDSNQGWIVLWFTPEWSGGDGVEHYLIQWSPNGYLKKNAADELEFSVASGVAITTNVAWWTVGSTNRVEVRWDADTTLDGANYLCISVNGAPTFGRTSSYTPEEPSSTIYVGSDANGRNQANGIIEGLTIFRRPGWDGANGINVGNGNEIAANSDKTLLTGSWDVTFCLPTHYQPVVLTSNWYSAWTHIHALNLLPGNEKKGGFMLAGDYATDGWEYEGTPVSVSALATGEKVFAGGYKVVSDGPDEGIYQDITVAAGNDWVVRAVAHSDGVSLPKLVLYNQSEGNVIGFVKGTNTSTRASPDVLMLTGEATGTCTRLRVKLVNEDPNPGRVTYWHQAEVLPNMINDPSLERGFLNANGNWQWAGCGAWEWESPNECFRETAFVHSGASSLKFTTSDNCNQLYSHSLGSLDCFFSLGGFMAEISGNQILSYSEQSYRNDGAVALYLSATRPTWSHYVGIFKKVIGIAKWVRLANSGATTSYFDDVYSFQLSNVWVTVTPASPSVSVERTGIRVDGQDVLLNVHPALRTASGLYQWRYTPRHAAANATSLGNTNAYVATFIGNSNNYVLVYYPSNNCLRLLCNIGATRQTNDWLAPTIVIGQTYLMALQYAAGSMELRVDGVPRMTLSSLPAFDVAPTNVYLGSYCCMTGTPAVASWKFQGDATFVILPRKGTIIRMR